MTTMAPPLNSGHKTNITAIETAINTALASLSSSPSDTYQVGVAAVLRNMRQDLELIRNERTQ